MRKQSHRKKSRDDLLGELRSARKDLRTTLLKSARMPTDAKKKRTLRRDIARITTALSAQTLVNRGKMMDDVRTGTSSGKQPTKRGS